ncbi:23S rRNA (uracil(1939)-C(5))-methyltransferase RlmD [Halopseudomonas salegens]|uniref:23S rRNA (uracil(1939)-C(5))-methyltransferase RlmD n=1 Tax=Halopseudomonas salegens TaxID=1434072 RepID=A0A1H2EEQ4_9GAMM|nr:23S rRNA (uracil(1939)-C(5))-methyltransferase RlmD [Halopseudomonas salegens]SDT93607.1 23S rRNA m(5)U-1939 methyltransferase [Halopseudomonas salegens]
MNRPRKRSRQSSAPAAEIGQRLKLSLERLSHDGRGIGHWQGRTVFVEGGLPGEHVEARVVRARSKLVEARLERLENGSEQRQQPQCQHASLCGGCSLQHMSPDQQLAFKQAALAQQLRHFAGVQPESWVSPLRGETYGYRQRTRIALHYGVKTDTLTVGFRQRASNELVALRECPVLAPVLQPLAEGLSAVLNRLQGCAHLGHVDLIASADRPVFLLRHLRPLSAADQQLLAAFAAEQGADCWLQPGGVETAAPMQATTPTLLTYRLSGQALSLYFAPGDFTQVNAEINQAMVTQAMEWLQPQPGEQILDLYCGLGNFSLPLARAGARVTGIEGSDAMVARATANAAENNLDAVHFLSADLSKPLDADWLQQSWSAALLDPPRDGAEQVVQALAALEVPRILYVSCNPATLARDAGLLASAGYQLQQAGIMDMFPQTAHIESMALFVFHGRKNRKRQ